MDDYAPDVSLTRMKGSLRYDGEPPRSLDGGKCRGCGEEKHTTESLFCKDCGVKVARFCRNLCTLLGRPVEYRATAGSTGGQLGHGDRQRAAIVELLKGGELSNTAIRDAVDGLNSSQAVLYQMHKLKDAGLVTWRKSDNNGRRGRYLWRLTETEETDAR